MIRSFGTFFTFRAGVTQGTQPSMAKPYHTSQLDSDHVKYLMASMVGADMTTFLVTRGKSS